MEAEALRGLAAWASQFTPRVTLALPATVLLEVSASLKLFKGLSAILHRQRAGLKAMGHVAAIAVAPTPMAAAWLARAGVEKHVAPARLQQVLAALPVSLLEDDEKTLAALENIGVRTLGELLALPRAGVARRFGEALIEELDKALGHQPDPRIWYQPPASFRAGIELPAEVSNAGQLIFAARRLVLQLCGYLAGRVAGVRRFSLELLHAGSQATLCVIGLVAPAADAGHLMRLTRERLQRTTLPRPVSGLVLAADAIEPLAKGSLSLFQDAGQASGEWQELVEHLRARLGKEAVSGLALCAEHRPEYASVGTEPGAARSAAARFGERPLWLLEKPSALPEQDAVPQYQGALKLLAGPERIESGWWDGREVKRDYFVALSRDGALLWIYRERQLDGRWYLHGFFA